MKVKKRKKADNFDNVAPLVGAWIERSKQNITSGIDAVAPLVGAWIERFEKSIFESTEKASLLL